MPLQPDSTGQPEEDGANLRFGLMVAGIVAGLCAIRIYSYLLFHSVVELFSIAVAWSMFLLAWNARRRLDNHYILFIAIASFAIGGINLVHTLAYRGMGVFAYDGGNLATQLWIAGQYVQSAAFLLAPLFIARRLRAFVALGGFVAVSLALVAAGLRGALPDCYVEGSGLTAFKVYSEYAITAALLVSIAALWRRRTAFDPAVRALLIAALVMTAAAELTFTLYVDVYGIANMAGHLLRFVAFCFLYRAIIVTGLQRPYNLLYRNLALSEERYRAFVENSTEGICRIELPEPIAVALPASRQLALLICNGYVAESNGTFARLHGRPHAAAMAGARLEDLLASAGAGGLEMIGAFVRDGCRTAGAQLDRTDGEGQSRHVEAAMAGTLERGHLVRIWLVERDITEPLRAAMERERLIAELRQALAEVKTLSGLLPICASCKKIRDDQGYWTRVETYLQDHTGVMFTHGICPGCARELYPDFDEEAGAGQ